MSVRRMTPTERLIAEAAIDVAVERMTTLHPGHQIFVFRPEGDPMWSHYEPDDTELNVFRLALTHLEAQKGAACTTECDWLDWALHRVRARRAHVVLGGAVSPAPAETGGSEGQRRTANRNRA